MHANKTRVRRLRDVKPTPQPLQIKGDDSFPLYTRIIAAAREYVRRKQVKYPGVAADFIERIISRALAELTPFDATSLGDDFDEQVRKIARRVFDQELQHHRWTEPLTETIQSSLPESSVHGTTERVLCDKDDNPLTRRPSRSKVIVATPVKLAEPDEDSGEQWSSMDNLAFADAEGRLGGSLRGQNTNVTEDRLVARLDRDNSIRRLVKIIGLDDLRFVIGYLKGDAQRSGANRTRWSRLKKVLVTNRVF